MEQELRENKESMTLKQYIEFVGEEAAAELFGAKRNTVRSWRYNQRQPSIKEAKKIILRTGGRLDFESIYGPLEEVE
jgi:hypothetical protein